MDTTIAFLTLLSVYVFVVALKKNKKVLFILTGLVMGLAVNTKYTGGLVVLPIVIYTWFWSRGLFMNKYFRASLIIPFVMILPWLFWNYKVYGISAVMRHEEIQIFLRQFYPFLLIALMGGLLTLYNWRLLRQRKWAEDFSRNLIKFCRNRFIKRIFKAGTGTVLFIFLAKYILRGLNFFHEPAISWRQYAFAHESPLFYLGRLLEYSLIYGFAYLGLFFNFHEKDVHAPLLKIIVSVFLTFFIIWGNFQCRYILPLLPFMIIIGVASCSYLYRYLDSMRPSLLAFSSRIIFRLFLGFVILRTLYLNYHLAYEKVVCYF
jgi:4-amino-4-deoxy-L-arabinose transferase-like glycosyltransferase